MKRDSLGLDLTNRHTASTNATYAACGIPVNDIIPTVFEVPAAFGNLAILMVIWHLVDRLLVHKSSLDHSLMSPG